MTTLVEPMPVSFQTMEERLTYYIAELPKSSVEIMTYLAVRGYSGNNSCAECPLAIYFSRVLGHEVLVVSDEALIYVSGRRSPVRAALPSWVQSFIADHDDHLYPQLFADIEE